MSLKCWTAPGVVFTSREELHEHYKSEWHKYNLKRKVAGLQPVPAVMFEKLEQIAKEHENAKNKVQKGDDHMKKGKERKQSKNAAPSSDQAGEEEQAEYEVDQVELKKEVDATVCFMDNNKSETMEDNLAYMQQKYGFFIPDVEFCDDLFGLFKYCSKKVRAGKLCLFCDKPFKTGEDAIKHMAAKFHCKIPWETEEDFDEYEEFYDYATLDDGNVEMNDGDDISASAVAPHRQKQNVELLDTGEVILTNPETGEGKRLGHRDLRQTYKQRFQPEETRESVLANSKERLLLMYKQAGVETGTKLTKIIANNGRPLWMDKTLAKQQRRDIHHRRKFELNKDMQVNLQIKNEQRKKKNIGEGYGVHG